MRGTPGPCCSRPGRFPPARRAGGPRARPGGAQLTHGLVSPSVLRLPCFSSDRCGSIKPGLSVAFEALCCPLVATGHVASFIPRADVLDGFPTRRGAPEGRPRLSWTPYMAGAGQMLGGPGPEERAARTETPPFPHPLSVDARGSPHDRCPVTVGCVREGRKVAADSVGFSAWVVGCHGLEHSCLTQERGDWQGPGHHVFFADVSRPCGGEPQGSGPVTVGPWDPGGQSGHRLRLMGAVAAYLTPAWGGLGFRSQLVPHLGMAWLGVPWGTAVCSLT